MPFLAKTSLWEERRNAGPRGPNYTSYWGEYTRSHRNNTFVAADEDQLVRRGYQQLTAKQCWTQKSGNLAEERLPQPYEVPRISGLRTAVHGKVVSGLSPRTFESR